MEESPPEVRTDGNSLLKAVYLSRLRLTRLLLEGGAYINESNERGETPLMVACRTHHTDAQSVPKPKMVKYLLESGADPNIQDKSGKTALMHACMERAGMEVLSLLLSCGADPSLEDHTGSSALVYAVNSGDKEALKVLLEACKAKGKEVIIITMDKLPSGRQMTKQYLNVPPPSDFEDCRHCTSGSCMSPSEIQLCTPPHPFYTVHSESEPLGQTDPGVASTTNLSASQPGSPTHGQHPAPPPIQAPGAARLLHLQRLHSEPWLMIPPSLLQQQSRGAVMAEDLQDITPEEELSFKINRLGFPHRTLTASHHQSIDVKEIAGLLRPSENVEVAGSEKPEQVGARGLLRRKMSYDSASALPHSWSHQNLSRETSTAEHTPLNRYVPESLPNLAVSSLKNIVHRRNLGMDHYSSDSQLTQLGSQGVGIQPGQSGSATDSTCVASAVHEKRKLVLSRSSTLSGSRESLMEGLSQRRAAGLLERRGSGALLLDHIAQTRPGYLPPLKPHIPIPDIKVNYMAAASASAATSHSPSVGIVGGCKLGAGAPNAATHGVVVPPVSKPLMPFAPMGPREKKGKKALLRRHSMQTEQIKQLANFEEIFGQ